MGWIVTLINSRLLAPVLKLSPLLVIRMLNVLWVLDLLEPTTLILLLLLCQHLVLVELGLRLSISQSHARCLLDKDWGWWKGRMTTVLNNGRLELNLSLMSGEPLLWWRSLSLLLLLLLLLLHHHGLLLRLLVEHLSLSHPLMWVLHEVLRGSLLLLMTSHHHALTLRLLVHHRMQGVSVWGNQLSLVDGHSWLITRIDHLELRWIYYLGFTLKALRRSRRMFRDNLLLLWLDWSKLLKRPDYRWWTNTLANISCSHRL